jgi:hypothetical protein
MKSTQPEVYKQMVINEECSEISTPYYKGHQLTQGSTKADLDEYIHNPFQFDVKPFISESEVFIDMYEGVTLEEAKPFV